MQKLDGKRVRVGEKLGRSIVTKENNLNYLYKDGCRKIENE